MANKPHAYTRMRAVLAGSLVLGVGATMTLAAWTDSEFGQASFSTSKFDTQSSVNGTLFADNATSPGATIAFDTTSMSPNTFRYGAVLVQTKIGSVAGTMTLAGATISPAGTDETTILGAALRYRVVQSTATCAAGLFTAGATYVVGTFAAPVALTTAQGAVTVNLAAATPVAVGASTGLCFEVSLPATAVNSLQGKSTTAIWHITATSS